MLRQNLISLSLFFLFFVTVSKYANCTLDFCIPNNQTEYKTHHDEVPNLIRQFEKNLEEIIYTETKTATAPIDYFHINFSHPALTMSGDLYNFTVDLGSHELKYLQFDLPAVDLFNLTFPSVMLQGSNYDLDGYVGKDGGLFRVYGSNGSFILNPLKLSIALKISLEANSSGICVPVHLAVIMQDMQVKFDHIMGSDSVLEPLFNKLIGSVGSESLGIFWDEAANAAVAPLQEVINKLLHWGTTNNNALVKLVSYIHSNKADISAGRIRKISDV